MGIWISPSASEFHSHWEGPFLAAHHKHTDTACWQACYFVNKPKTNFQTAFISSDSSLESPWELWEKGPSRIQVAQREGSSLLKECSLCSQGLYPGTRGENGLIRAENRCGFPVWCPQIFTLSKSPGISFPAFPKIVTLTLLYSPLFTRGRGGHIENNKVLSGLLKSIEWEI